MELNFEPNVLIFQDMLEIDQKLLNQIVSSIKFIHVLHHIKVNFG